MGNNEFVQSLLEKRKSLEAQLAAVTELLKAEGYADTSGLPAEPRCSNCVAIVPVSS